MKRRDFLKYLGSGVVGAGVGIGISQVTKVPGGAKLMPYLVPPENVIPGVANWYASLCTSCSAGCGITVKVMEGRAKKIEGNPLHPLNQGGLCARGQASLQSLYNPDRIKTPLKRTGAKGSGKFQKISWDEALSMLSKNLTELSATGAGNGLYLLSTPVRGHLGVLLADFMTAYGSANYLNYELFQHANLRYANKAATGLNAVPHYDIENTKYLLSFGADFSTTWLSPVGMSRGYGKMRQGSGERGKLVSVEPRMSLTGANADEWVPARPGTEALLALAIAAEIVNKGFYHGADAGSFRTLLSGVSVKDAAHVTEVSESRIRQIASEFAHSKAPLAIGGETLSSYSNGVSGQVAVNILNHVAGSLGKKGGVIANPETTLAGAGAGQNTADIAAFINDAAGGKVKSLIVNNTNPVFTTPKGLKTEAAIKAIPFVASLSSFMDETTALADLILPTNTSLEDWGDDFTDPGVGTQIATFMQPAVSPYYKTKSVGDIFLALSGALGGATAEKLPQSKFTVYLKNSWKKLYNSNSEMKASAGSFGKFWNRLLENGGWWPESDARPRTFGVSAGKVKQHVAAARGQAKFAGDDKSYPLYLVLYSQTAYLDGRGANLPWMQEMPDPMTSVVWGSWVEINPKTAKKLGIKRGDMVAISSPDGTINAPAYLSEGIRPDTVAVPIGQGHSSYGKYSFKDNTGRKGVNPLEILPVSKDPASGEIALNSTRVKLTLKTGAAKLGIDDKLGATEGTTKELGRNIVQTVSLKEFKKMKG